LYTIIAATILTIGLWGCEVLPQDDGPEEPLDEDVQLTITLNHQTVSLLVGDLMQLHHMLSPDTVKVTDLVWTSSNPQIATVSQTGMVTALAIGQTEIKVSSAAKEAQAAAQISVIPTALSEIRLEAEVIPAYINEAKTLPLTFIPDNATNKSVTWTTSDQNIVGIDQNGAITAKKLGYAWISVQQGDPVHDNAIIVPAVSREQLIAVSQINASGQKHFINVYVAALAKTATVNEVKLYLGSKGDPNSSELKTVTPNVTFAAGKGGEIAIEVNATEANQLTYGRYVRLDVSVGGAGYYVYVSWTNAIEIVGK